MSQVRRCDYPACTNGPDGTPAVSDIANPAGWITATRLTSGTLAGDQQSKQGDFDTALCAARTLFSDLFVYAELPPPPSKAPRTKQAARSTSKT